jgi:hypothetical protein
METSTPAETHCLTLQSFLLNIPAFKQIETTALNNLRHYHRFHVLVFYITCGHRRRLYTERVAVATADRTPRRPKNPSRGTVTSVPSSGTLKLETERPNYQYGYHQTDILIQNALLSRGKSCHAWPFQAAAADDVRTVGEC